MREGDRRFRADRGDGRKRLDHVLQRHLADRPDASRTRIQHWIEAGAVTVNGRPARRPACRVAADSEIAVALPALPVTLAHAPEDVPLDVLFEDDHVLAVAKPAGLIVHPSYGHRAGTLVNALLARARAWPAGGRPGLVHRLDKHTSGVVLVAKSRDAHGALARAMAARVVRKEYLAVVVGRVPRRDGEIRLPLARDPADRRRVVVSASGRESVTRYERLRTSRGERKGVALLRCRLVTGRMHQIRVHLAACGWPIAGDPVYGSRGRTAVAHPGLDALVRAFPRQALHAWRVSLPHPVTGAALEIVAPLPDDMRRLVAAAGLRGAVPVLVPPAARHG